MKVKYLCLKTRRVPVVCVIQPDQDVKFMNILSKNIYLDYFELDVLTTEYLGTELTFRFYKNKANLFSYKSRHKQYARSKKNLS